MTHTVSLGNLWFVPLTDPQKKNSVKGSGSSSKRFADLCTSDRPPCTEFSTMPGRKAFVVGVGMTKVRSEIIFWG